MAALATRSGRAAGRAVARCCRVFAHLEPAEHQSIQEGLKTLQEVLRVAGLAGGFIVGVVARRA